jgi:hypothetical protein
MIIVPDYSGIDLNALNFALGSLEQDEQAVRWRNDPNAWITERLGEETWSKQRLVLSEVANNPLVTVQSGHGIGKSWLASRLVGWFLATRPLADTFVVTTAPTNDQVRAVLWRYITQMWIEHDLPGHVSQTAQWKINSQLVAYGRKPADYSESSFQGIHAENLLVILDEAGGIPKQLWIAADALATGANSHILAIGNPDSTSTHFHTVCTTEVGWKRIHISSLDSPNITGEKVSEKLKRTLVNKEWIEDKRRRWGENNALYKAKVLGEFADDEDGLIPLSWVSAANARWNAWNEGRRELTGRTVLGVDVGHMGADKTIIAHRQGDVVLKLEEWAKQDTVAVAGLVQQRLRAARPSVAVVDAIGVGAGVVDILRSRGCTVRPFVASAKWSGRDSTSTQGFLNKRGAAWWNLRELLDPAMDARLCLPPDDDLTADLTTPRFEPVTGAKIKIESKDDIKRRLGRSTDRGDAVAMALWSDSYARVRSEQATVLRPVSYTDRPDRTRDDLSPLFSYEVASRRR